jgi:hypothetical protein
MLGWTRPLPNDSTWPKLTSKVFPSLKHNTCENVTFTCDVFLSKADSVSSLVKCTWTLKRLVVGKNWGTLKSPHELSGCQIRAGGSPPREVSAPARIFSNPPENRCPSRPKKIKINCSCILEGCLTTNPILSALHLQGLKSNIYICALPPSK